MYEQENSKEQIIVNFKSFPNVIPSKIISATSFFFLDEHQGCALEWKFQQGAKLYLSLPRKWF